MPSEDKKVNRSEQLFNEFITKMRSENIPSEEIETYEKALELVKYGKDLMNTQNIQLQIKLSPTKYSKVDNSTKETKSNKA